MFWNALPSVLSSPTLLWTLIADQSGHMAEQYAAYQYHLLPSLNMPPPWACTPCPLLV